MCMDEQVAQEEEKEDEVLHSKNARRRANLRKKKEADAEAKENAKGPKKSMDDVLFRQNIRPESESFKAESLFETPVLAAGLNRVHHPAALQLTPAKLYEQIKKWAETRFQHTLPEDQRKLKCLQSVGLKSALLRDLCKSIGL